MAKLACALTVLAAGCPIALVAPASAFERRPPQEAGPVARAAGPILRFFADSSGELRFSRSRFVSRPGSVTLRMANPSPLRHAVAIRGKRGRTAATGGVSIVTVKLRAGRYRFYCPIDGHAAAGMEGRLTVR